MTGEEVTCPGCGARLQDLPGPLLCPWCGADAQGEEARWIEPARRNGGSL